MDIEIKHELINNIDWYTILENIPTGYNIIKLSKFIKKEWKINYTIKKNIIGCYCY